MNVPLPTRRTFLKQTGAVAAGTAAFGLMSRVRAKSANDKIVMALIGPGGMGTSLLKSFAAQPDVSMAYVCDPDEARLNKAADEVEKISAHRPKQVKDMRRIFEDKDVDAVIIATPDHWHGPATVLACDAGKHVYVEKPCAHNMREGRLMIEAARRNKRVVQVGTQSRSGEHLIRAVELLRSGAIGDVLVAKVWNSQLRASIGHEKPAPPPSGFDYDLWVGPAPMVPFQKNRQHGWWRWWYDFGTGDMGNDGVHDLDIGRWGLGVETHPTRIVDLGGKYFFDDDQQFPDTETVIFEYPAANGSLGTRQLIYEQRIWSPYVQEGHENGNAFYGTKGMLILGKGAGWKLYGPKNELREEMKSVGLGLAHHRNFLECIWNDRKPNADIEIGHLSAALSHLGNIATRVGRMLRFDPKTERILGDRKAAQLVRRRYRSGHWAVPRGV